MRKCKEMMFNQLNKLNMVDAAELRTYINRIVDDMDKAQLAAMEKAPLGYAASPISVCAPLSILPHIPTYMLVRCTQQRTAT